MKKYILIAIVSIFIGTTGYSQTSLYTLDYTMGLGVGSTGDYIGNMSFRGLTFEGRGFVTDNISVGALFNWSTFYEAREGETYTHEYTTITGNQYRYINAFPMLAQAHYYFATDPHKTRFYLGAGVGTYKINQETDIGVWALSYDKWHFGVSPEVGVVLPIGYSTMVNLSVRYHYAVKTKKSPEYSWLGFSVGFAWGN